MASAPAWPRKGAGKCSSPAVRRGVLASASEPPSGLGFPRSARLIRPADFQRVFGQGRRNRSRYFTLVVAPGSERPRLGLAVGRRASPRAVVRNRIKRIARDVFRHATLPQVDIVVVARSGLEDVSREELRDDLQRALARVEK